MVLAVAVLPVMQRCQIAFRRKARVQPHRLLGVRRRSGFVAHLRQRGSKEGVVRMVGPRDAAERLDRFGVAPPDKIGTAEMVPKSLGMMRVETHRPLHPVDALFWPTYPGQELALLHHNEIVIGVE